ncbi:MAG: hypothetical protein MUO31_06595 [Thermodesulfovibrionales bacterium]|nr:hypothetical protein [Thermodesulfovibrionales bacterium]
MSTFPKCKHGIGDANNLTECKECQLDDLQAELDKLKASHDRQEEALRKIDNWAKAYPLEVFPEPDFKKVAEVLKAAGISLDAVSASNMRHVIKGVKGIAEQALKEAEKIGE